MTKANAERENELLIDGLRELAAAITREDARSLCSRAANALEYFYGTNAALTEQEQAEADYLRVERVARAFLDDRRTRLLNTPSWDALPDYDKDELRHHARVAVSAIRAT